MVPKLTKEQIQTIIWACESELKSAKRILKERRKWLNPASIQFHEIQIKSFADIIKKLKAKK